MKLHLPKALLTVIVASAFALPIVQAEGASSATVKASTDLTYNQTVYTLGSTPANNTLASVFQTTLVPAEGSEPAKWNVDQTASNKGWGELYGDGKDAANTDNYNTLRIVAAKEYGFKFSPMTLAGVIVESSADGASFKGLGNSLRCIKIGNAGEESASYFGGSFTFDSYTTSNNTSSITLNGTQTWHVVSGKEVTLKAKAGISNEGTWTVEGGGAIVLSSKYTNNGTWTVEGSSVKITNSTIYNSSAITLSDEKLIFYAAALLDAVDEESVSYSEGDNGYQSGDFYLVKGTGDSATVTSTAETALESASGKSYSVKAEDGSLIVTLDGEGGLYHVNTEVNYGGKDGNATIEAGTTTGILMSGGTLNLNQALAEGIAITTANKAGSVIHIGAGVTLDNTDVVDMGTKSAVSGGATAVYDLAAATTANATFGTEWYGTTKLTGTTLTGSVDLASFANGENSTIEFSATSGWITAKTNTFNVLLAEGNAITFNNGGNNEHHVFTGKISGTGNIVRQSNTGSFQYYDVQGDVSGWTGTFEHKNTNSAHESTITLSGDATTVNANFLQSGGDGGKLSVVVNNTNDVTMSGSVSATAGTIKLQNSGTGKVKVAEVRAIGGNVQLSGTGSNEIEIGTLSIAEGNTVGNGVTTTRNNNANSSTNDAGVNVIITTKLDANRTEGVALTGALTLKDGVTVDVADLLQDDTYTYNLASATNGVTVGTYSVTGLGDAYSSYQGRVSAVDPNAAAGVAAAAEGNSNTKLVLTLELVKLTVNGTNGYANGVLTLTTEEKATGAIFGESLAASVSDDIWAQITKDYTLDEEYSITFVGADGTTFDFDGDGTLTAPTITFMGETATALTGNGTIVGTFTIPEPTTATLSLLALAALAARRRRR